MKKIIPLLLLTFILVQIVFSQKDDCTKYVNVFNGTKNMGHTFPGACVPFGMVQLSPETDTVMYEKDGKYNPDVYRYCSGYQYQDNTIVGFSHTHFSGTGHSDLGDFLIMPTTGELKFNPGNKFEKRSGYRSDFRKKTETGKPGYYSVFLDDYNVKAELTATARTGFHKYTFPQTNDAHIILDMFSGIYNYDGKVLWSTVSIENDTLITGWRLTSGWARTRYVYFAMILSKPVSEYGFRQDDKPVYKGFWRKFNQTENFPEFAGRNVKMFLNYSTAEGEIIKIKFGLSAVSTESALNNLLTENPGWDFEAVSTQASELWNNELNKIQITASEKEKKIFYTSMYHAFISPVIYNDVNGKYRGLDQNIYKSEGFNNYTIFSLWDTYRALHPLFTIIQEKKNRDMVISMLKHYEQSVHKMLPVWSHWSNENWCMIGYHSVSVLADAYLKNPDGLNPRAMLDAVVNTSNSDYYDGIGYYKKYGYVPEDLNSNSVSKTLEYSYDDWTIMKLASAMGDKETANEYFMRSRSFEKHFDDSSKFMRAKNSNGKFRQPFDALSTVNQGYIEGNAWNYSFYVPHSEQTYIRLMGGNEVFTARLDTLFSMQISDEHFSESEDITRDGIIGNYVHGNEPGHHIPYLYVYAGMPWKTQEKVNMIMKEMYDDAPDGLCGNDDCGQMSAWYIFSALGFYPVCPGSSEYVFGAPYVEKAVLNLENGRTFSMTAENFSENNIYIQKILLNGKDYKKTFIRHEDIMNGGNLVFVMGNKPNKDFGKGKEDKPYSME
jgi:predicted alpha-1,2-mannosidase